MKKIVTLILASLMALCAYAESSVKVKAPNLVGLNEQFNVSFEIQGDDAPKDFNWNPGDDFQLVWGPQKGTSRSVSIVNGTRSATSTTSYTYVLMPKTVGHFTLNAATFNVNGKDYSSERPEIEVVADGANSQSQQQQQSDNAAQNGRVSEDDIFMRLSISKRNVIVGEPITASLKLYQRVSLAGLEGARFPEFNGFWSQDLAAPSNIEFQRESIDGKIYQSALIHSWTLIPQQAGDLKIEPAELTCLINVRVPRASTGSIFDDFFHDDYRTLRQRLTTEPVTVKVAKLPAGAPASFGGGVGKFNMKVELGHTALKTHDASSLKITVSGKGNISLLEAPKVKFPADFELYDMKSSEQGGAKVFEYPFIPRSHGEFVIEPVEYSYFDIDSRKYVSLESEALALNVEKGSQSESNASAGQIVSGVTRKDVRDLGSDIRFLHTAVPALSLGGAFFAGSSLFWILIVLLIILAVVMYFAFRSYAARKADVVGSKNRAAVKMARKRFALAKQFLDKNLYSAFYEELHKALLGYVSDKLNMDAGDLSKDNIASRLESAGASEGLVADFVGLIDACEFARYAPDSGNEAMSAHYDQAVNILSVIDSSMKKTKSSVSAAAALALMLMISPSLALDAQESIDNEALWAQGVEAYQAGMWSDAISAWSEIEDAGYVSSDLYYNLGGAYFKNDDIAHAVLYYERALKLDPSNKDARFNLDLASSMVQDKIELLPEFFLTKWMRTLCWMLSFNAWAWIAIALFALTLALVLLYLLGASVAQRRSGFVCGIVALMLCFFAGAMSFWQRADYFASDSAVITRAVANVKSSPTDSDAKDLFVLHEGTKVRLLDELGAWRNIELSDGRQGWIRSTDLELI